MRTLRNANDQALLTLLPYAALVLLLVVVTRSPVAPIGGGIGMMTHGVKCQHNLMCR